MESNHTAHLCTGIMLCLSSQTDTTIILKQNLKSLFVKLCDVGNRTRIKKSIISFCKPCATHHRKCLSILPNRQAKNIIDRYMNLLTRSLYSFSVVCFISTHGICFHIIQGEIDIIPPVQKGAVWSNPQFCAFQVYILYILSPILLLQANPVDESY